MASSIDLAWYEISFAKLIWYRQVLYYFTEKDGTISRAHCLGCKAGLADSYSHIASVLLFYLEAWTKVNGRLSCTQMKCSWILPSLVSEVEYARVRDINFKSDKKMKADLDATIENLTEDLQFFGDSNVFTENPAQKPEFCRFSCRK